MKYFLLLTIAFSLAFAKHINNFDVENEDYMDLDMKRPLKMDTGSAMSGLEVRGNEESQNLDTRSSSKNERNWIWHHLFYDYSKCAAHNFTAHYLYKYLSKSIPDSVDKALMVQAVKDRINAIRAGTPKVQNCNEGCMCLTGSPGSCKLEHYLVKFYYNTTDKEGHVTTRKSYAFEYGYDCICEKKYNPLEVLAEAFYNGKTTCIEKKEENPTTAAGDIVSGDGNDGGVDGGVDGDDVMDEGQTTVEPVTEA